MNMLSSKTKHNGFAILIVLVAVAILMLLYFVQIDTFFGPRLPKQPAGIENHPWVLEDLLIPAGETVKLPGSPKLQLDKPVTVTAPVSRNGTNRGDVTIDFDIEGRINVKWDGSYEQAGLNYTVNAEMDGNIHSKRTYQDENGKDKSRLFFIARGRYSKMPLIEAPGAGAESGTAWTIGWILPNQTAQGHLTLTQNQEWAAVYTFQTSE